MESVSGFILRACIIGVGLFVLALVLVMLYDYIMTKTLIGWKSVRGAERTKWVSDALEVALKEGFDESDPASYYDSVAACMNKYFRAYHVRLTVTASEAEMYVKDRATRPVSTYLQLFR